MELIIQEKGRLGLILRKILTVIGNAYENIYGGKHSYGGKGGVSHLRRHVESCLEKIKQDRKYTQPQK